MKSLFLNLCLLCASACLALDLGTIAPNTWYTVPAQADFLMQYRPWNTLLHNGQGSILLYNGAGPTANGTYCIYSNAMASLDVTRDSVHLLKQSNYYCQYGLPSPLPENDTDATPMDRHGYNQIAYSPLDTSVYLIHGASGSENHRHDFWRYSLPQRKWYLIGAAPGPTAAYDCECEKNLIEAEGELWYFENCRDIHVYNVGSGLWRYHRIGDDRYAVAPLGAHGMYDSNRHRFVFYGAGDWGASSALMPMFQKDSLTWSTRTGPIALNNAAIVYNSRHDVYMLGKGRRDSIFIYSPVADSWDTAQISGSVGAGSQYVELVYDPVNDLLVNQKSSGFFAMRYAPETVPQDSTPACSSLPPDTVVIRDTVVVRDTVTLQAIPGYFIVGGDTLLMVPVAQ